MRAPEQLALDVEQPFYWVPVCVGCGERLAAVPHVENQGDRWWPSVAWCLIALDAHRREGCPGADR